MSRIKIGDDDSEEDKKLIRVKFDESALEYKDRSYRGCQHRRVLVDPHLRTVECRECETLLDPVTVLIEYARFERRFYYVKSKMSEMHEKIGQGSIGPATAAAGPLMSETERKLARLLDLDEAMI